MRQLLPVVALFALLGFVEPARAQFAGRVTGLPLYSERCVDEVRQVFAGVRGVSDVRLDLATRSATLKVKDEKVVLALHQAMSTAGVAGKLDFAGIEIKATAVLGPEADKRDVVEFTAKDLRVFDESCEKAIAALFKDCEVRFVDADTKGRRDAIVTGEKLDTRAIVKKLKEAGFVANLGAIKTR